MDSKQINIPPATEDLTMNRKKNTLTIHAARTCNWCYSDPGNVFGGTLPAPGQLAAGDHGPYTAVSDGRVEYNGVDLDKTCSTTKEFAGGHTITVGS